MENDFWQVGQRCRRFVAVERGMSDGVVSMLFSWARGMGSTSSRGGHPRFYICVNPGRPFTDLCT